MIERKWRGFNLQEPDFNWYEVETEDLIHANMDRYFYRVNGVEYYHDSPAFIEILNKIQVWNKLQE